MQYEEEAGPSNSNAVGGGIEGAWGRLPSCAIERIFSFLNPKDRALASIVCRSWADAYESPSLWRTPVLSFSKGNRSRPCFNPTSVVRRFGRFFRKLTIMCRNERRRTHKSAHHIISDFFHHMEQEGVQLESFRMPRLMVLSRHNSTNQIILSVDFVKFLRMQTGLTTVNFTNGSTHTSSCLEILENLVADNVQHLYLQNFFRFPNEIGRSTRFLESIIRFHGLRSLSLNYRYLTNEVMSSLASHLEGHLEMLGILCEKCKTIQHSITDDSWSLLKTKCPNMGVHFKLELYNLQTTHFIGSQHLSPEMPLVSMKYQLNNTWIEQFDHIICDYLATTFTSTLREVEFDVRGFRDDGLRSGVADVVGRCTVLENLIMRVRFPFFEIQELFDTILNVLDQQMINRGTTSLKLFRITLRGLNPISRERRIYLGSTYIPKFRETGVQLKMKMKK